MSVIMPKSGPSRFFNPRNPFFRAVILALIILTIISLSSLRPSNERLTQLQQHIPGISKMHQTPPKYDCAINSSHLLALQEKFDFDDQLQYAKRYIKYVPTLDERPSITKLNQPLFPNNFDKIEIHNPPHFEKCPEPLEVPVVKEPVYPGTVDASGLLFGISTVASRLNDPEIGPMKEWAHWLTDGKGHSNGAGLILLLVDATDDEIEQASKDLKALGIDAKVQHSDSNTAMAERYLSLLPTLYNHPSRTSRQWLVMCDDDTFFPYMHSLLAKLATYDHTQDLYVGTLSEDVNNVQRHGSQAFGGAGVFFSVPMAAKVTALFPQCKTKQKLKEADSGWGPQGDILLRKCIYEHTEVRLTLLRDLYQLDLYGDPSGFYESGLKPYSIHHFKGGNWHKANPLQLAQSSYACGEDCIMQRYQFSDDFILTNGYSIASYPKGIDFDVHQMERTFAAAPSDNGWNLDYVFGPQRKSLPTTGRKVSWDLVDVTHEPGGVLRQIYLRYRDDPRWTQNEQAIYEVDGLVELIWTP